MVEQQRWMPKALAARAFMFEFSIQCEITQQITNNFGPLDRSITLASIGHIDPESRL